LVGVALVAGRLHQSPRNSIEASIGGLTARSGQAGWVSMDAHSMDSQGGFQMPAQMMPGAPAGDEMRLGVPLTLINTSAEAREFNLREEFFLAGGASDTLVALHSDTFGLLGRLSAGSAVNGVLYFDTTVPTSTDPPLVLRWTRNGASVDIAIPWTGGPAATHTHGP
jgi:hypothetical protein